MVMILPQEGEVLKSSVFEMDELSTVECLKDNSG
jgi:hypothetical protein